MSLAADARRLHPATVVLNVIRRAPGIVFGVPAFLAFARNFEIWQALLVGLCLALIAAAWQCAEWWRFTYAITEDAVVIEGGVLSRNRRTIPLSRVQDVAIERKLLARIFGLARVTLETGGAGEDEGALDSVSLAEAHRLREVIRRRAAMAPAVDSEADATAAGPAPAIPDAPELFAMALPRVLVSGLFNFSLVWLAVIFGGLQYVESVLPFDIWDWGRLAQVDHPDALVAQVAISAWAAIAAMFLLLGVVAGLVRTVLRDFGFTLTDEGGRYRRVRGLFTHTEAVISLRRVQLALIESGLFRRMFGWAGLRLQTLGGSGDAGGRQEAAPFAQAEEIDAVLAPLDMAQPDPAALRQVSRGHVWRAVLRATGLPLAVILIGALFAPIALFALPLLAPLLIVALLRRRFHRYAVERRALYVQRGVLNRQMWIVPTHNVQAITISRTWLQRRLGTASVQPDTAGAGAISHPVISDIRSGDAWAVARDLRA